jgi:butyrate kinase
MPPFDSYLILVINPGSTSTKLALSRGGECLKNQTIRHSTEELKGFSSVAAQKDFRRELTENFLAEALPKGEDLAAVIGRGGLLAPLESGIYTVSSAMIADLESARWGEHASNLGAVLAEGIARPRRIPAYIADPVVVDEMIEEARYSGCPEIQRVSIFHALNQKSAARKAAAELGRSYEEVNLIVAHLGGGISVGAHQRGRVIDVNNALDGDGPFSPERSGGLPAGQLVSLALQYREREKELRKKIVGLGGMAAYLGTNDFVEALERASSGDAKAQSIIQAMAYQISKEIAAHGATLKGKIDGIVLTGGMAGSAYLTNRIRDRVSYLGPILIIEGEREMEALAENALGALRQTREVKEYQR